MYTYMYCENHDKKCVKSLLLAVELTLCLCLSLFLSVSVSVCLCLSLSPTLCLCLSKSKWHPEITHHTPHAPILLVGTKLDLRDDPSHKNPITYTEGMDLQKRIGAERYFECSALTRTGLQQIFEEACRIVLHPGTPKKKKSKMCLLL